MTRATAVLQAARQEQSPFEASSSANRNVEALRLLNEAAAELLMTEDSDALVARLLPRFHTFLSADICLHYRLVDECSLQLHSALGIDEEVRDSFGRLAIGEGVCGLAAHERCAQYVEDVQSSERAEAIAIRGLGVHAYACHPLLARGRLLGTLGFGSRTKVGFDDDERRVMATLAHYLAIAWDRLEVARRLAESESRYRDLADTVPQMLWAADAQGHTLFFNRRWCEYTGQQPEAAARADLLHFVHPDDRAATHAAWRVAAATGAAFRAEFRLRRADGAWRWHLTDGAPLRDAKGRVLRWCGGLTDIHDRRCAEAAHRESERRATALVAELAVAERDREALLDAERAARMEADRAARTKDEFLATISHELRTPLNAVLGWARLLKKPGLDAQAFATGVDVIERNARVQAQLITDLLDVNRIVSGKLTLELETLQVGDVVRAAVQAAAPAAADKRIALDVDFAPDLPEVAGDPARLQQVVGNLLTNAVKFTPEQGRIRVNTRRHGAGVEIVVADSGEGIEPDVLPHVFDRFRQGDTSIGRRHGGLGLGLAIVRQLVQLHGGAVTAESPGRGCGATFTVTLPARAVANSDLRASGRWRFDARDAVPKLDGLRVLLVDDQQDALEFLRQTLRDYGANPRVASSTAEALALLQSGSAAERPELLISDIGMPGLDGYELLRRVRALSGCDAERLPAIALTAFARDADQRAALASGFQAHVAKPVQMHELLSAILRWRPRSAPGRGSGEGP
ncbi:MAG: ATP-binding protein [Steroidobacteraceae bacterium]|jgi:PAS domain S-box-containing protein|nr:ATP-binding protein [Steroidobacteraceae bacterium]